jgi:hypothetical protein
MLTCFGAVRMQHAVAYLPTCGCTIGDVVSGCSIRVLILPDYLKDFRLNLVSDCDNKNCTSVRGGSV